MPIKTLAYIANVRFPSTRAHATQIAHMCEAFSKSGISVNLFVSNREYKEGTLVRDFFDFEPSFAISRVPFRFIFFSSPIFFLLNNIYFCFWLLLNVDFKKFDVIYTRDEWLCYFLSFFIPIEKLVYESHEAKYNLPARRILRTGVKCVVVSQGIFGRYQELGVPVAQMMVADDAIDDSFFVDIVSKEDARKQLSLPSDAKVVMYIGGFDVWKGVDIFFEASKKNKDVMFVAIGGKESELKEYKSKYPKVNFLGPRPYKDLKNHQQAADVLVIPNTAKTDLSSKYTSPLKLFAHMASGVPLILSRIPSLTNIVEDGEAYFFKPDDVVSLSEVISAVTFSAELKTGAKCLKARSKMLTWGERSKKIISFIRGGK